jgi:hypothetical protein
MDAYFVFPILFAVSLTPGRPEARRATLEDEMIEQVGGMPPNSICRRFGFARSLQTHDACTKRHIIIIIIILSPVPRICF